MWIQINHKDLDYHFFIICVFAGNNNWVKDLGFCEISLSLNNLLSLNFSNCEELALILTNYGHKISKPVGCLYGLLSKFVCSSKK